APQLSASDDVEKEARRRAQNDIRPARAGAELRDGTWDRRGRRDDPPAREDHQRAACRRVRENCKARRAKPGDGDDPPAAGPAFLRDRLCELLTTAENLGAPGPGELHDRSAADVGDRAVRPPR